MKIKVKTLVIIMVMLLLGFAFLLVFLIGFLHVRGSLADRDLSLNVIKIKNVNYIVITCETSQSPCPPTLPVEKVDVRYIDTDKIAISSYETFNLINFQEITTRWPIIFSENFLHERPDKTEYNKKYEIVYWVGDRYKTLGFLLLEKRPETTNVRVIKSN